MTHIHLAPSLAEAWPLAQDLITAFDPDEVMAAFVAGSCATDQGRVGSDVDVFACLRRTPTAAQLARFRTAYFAMHEELGLQPDTEYPGEVMGHGDLSTALTAVDQSPATASLTDPLLFDGIVWAGMLWAPKRNLTESAAEMDPLHIMAGLVVTRWAAELDPTSSLPADQILKQRVQYHE